MLYGLKEKEVQFPREQSAQLPPEGERRVGGVSWGSSGSGREQLTQLCPVTAAQSPVGATIEHEEVTRQLDGWVRGLSALPKVTRVAITASQSEPAPTPGVRRQISDVCWGACGAERSRGDWTAQSSSPPHLTVPREQACQVCPYAPCMYMSRQPSPYKGGIQ